MARDTASTGWSIDTFYCNVLIKRNLLAERLALTRAPRKLIKRRHSTAICVVDSLRLSPMSSPQPVRKRSMSISFAPQEVHDVINQLRSQLSENITTNCQIIQQIIIQQICLLFSILCLLFISELPSDDSDDEMEYEASFHSNKRKKLILPKFIGSKSSQGIPI